MIYAADSAAHRLVDMGFPPIVVGDLDSFDPAWAGQLRIVHVPDQSRTDCDKLLKLVEADGHVALTLACLEGDLLDHVLASLSSVARSSLDIRLALRRGVAYTVRPGRPVACPDVVGQRVSFLPLDACSGVSLEGVQWPVRDGTMAPGGFLSISNKGTGDVSASVEQGNGLLFVGTDPRNLTSW